MAACIHCIVPQQPRDEAILAHFTNGRLNVTPHGPSQAAPQFGCFASTNVQDVRKKHRRILAAETDTMEYVGYNFGKNASRSTSVCKYMVGVLDKKSGKMQLHDAQVFTVRPKVPGSEDLTQLERRELSLAEKADNLTEVFGGAKKKRAMESRIRNKLGEDELDHVMGAAIQLAKKQPSLAQSFEDFSNNDEVSFLPPFDKTASKPEEVFKLHDIIRPSHLEMLQSPARVFMEASKEDIEGWKSDSQYPSYILRHLRILPSNMEKKEHTTSCLMYLHYLLILFHAKAKDFSKKELFPVDIPKAVGLSILDTFTLSAINPKSSGKPLRYMPSRLKDKLLSYIIILSLHIDDFEVNLNQLLPDLRIPSRRCLSHISTIGCKVQTSKRKTVLGTETARVVTLPVPFKLPDLAQRSRKRHRNDL